ncbi:hypothetical protein OSB04_011411 [Centaurea solstitialis]|uniref:CCHC-type domain-containing protein n=1 Tax=Centaurea solstitialis TaxID=347529 RepID=A0AA38TSG4_9ASTR|nr:hypothetical protein OSB04_011411 [Centaurea solstitialis]
MIKESSETTIDMIVLLLTTKEVRTNRETGKDRIPTTTIRDSQGNNDMGTAITTKETKEGLGMAMMMKEMIIDLEATMSMEEAITMEGGQIKEQQKGSNSSQTRTPQQPANLNRSDGHGATCYKCGKPGHYTKECTVKFKDAAYFEKKAALMRKKEKGVALLVEEENWVCEEESSDDEQGRNTRPSTIGAGPNMREKNQYGYDLGNKLENGRWER